MTFRSLRVLAEKIQNHFLVFFLVFLVGVGWLIQSWGALILAWLGFELLIGVIFILAYGVQFRQTLFGYFLVTDADYGNSFRKSCRSKDLNFLLFDRFIFPAATERILDLEANRRARLEFNINSLGFRGEEFNPDTKINKLRIFCSGGSTTACDRNDDQQAWPAQMQKCLRAAGWDIEVINAGVQGWYSYQELLRFKKEIIRYQPDVVLLHQGWNEEFEYSSLSLGQTWKPRALRNVIEEHYLYCPANPVLSQTKFLSLYFLCQFYFKKINFSRHMSFFNPKRWEVLKKEDYLLAWFDNMIEIACLAQENNILLYTIDYPALVHFNNLPEERKIYIENSRLTPLYADYQAISKLRISRLLSQASQAIPNLNADEDFNEIKGLERLKLFHDEIHMTPQGNSALAQSLYQRLIKQPDFRDRYESINRKSNVNADLETILKIRRTLKTNPAYLDRFINAKIDELKNKKGPQASGRHITRNEIPAERYTTY